MVSAPDIITYVGVPLTVMGIMPILWNFFKAFWIRFGLTKTIPWQLRPFYTISADAANGEVTVVVDSISCVHPGLWPDKKSAVQCNLTPGTLFKRWSHRIFYRWVHQCGPIWEKLSKWTKATFSWLPRVEERMAIIETDPDSYVGELGEENKRIPAVWDWRDQRLSLEPRAFCLDEPDLLFRPWMAVAAKLGLCIHKELQYSHGLFLKRPALRFTVGMDMEMPRHPTLAMDATEFLWFALSLGVNPLSFDPTKPDFVYGKRSDYGGKPIVRFFNIEGDWCFELVRGGTKQQRSISLALAWVNVICSERDGSIFCRRVLQPTDEEVPLSKSFFAAYRFHPTMYERSDPKAIREALAATIEWAENSWRNSQSTKEVAFPISQCMLETRERSLCRLRGIDNFKIKLISLFHERLMFADLPGIPELSSSQANPAARPTFCILGAKEVGQETEEENDKERSNGNRGETNEPPDHFSNEACAKYLENLEAKHREEVLQGRSPANTPKSVTVFQPNGIAGSAYEILQKRFNESQYVTKSFQVGASLRSIRDKIMECRDRSASETDTLTAAMNIFAELEQECNSSLKPEEGSAFPEFFRYPSIEGDFWIRSTKFKKSSVWNVAHALIQKNDAGSEAGDEAPDDSTMLLAHVILGCLDWGSTQRTPWEVDKTIASDMHQIRKRLETPNFDVDELCQFLDQAAERAECGIYTASTEPVLDLFEKFRDKGTVYLI